MRHRFARSSGHRPRIGPSAAHNSDINGKRKGAYGYNNIRSRTLGLVSVISLLLERVAFAQLAQLRGVYKLVGPEEPVVPRNLTTSQPLLFMSSEKLYFLWPLPSPTSVPSAPFSFCQRGGVWKQYLPPLSC